MTGTFYKAVRADGTDYCTGALEYEVGSIVRAPGSHPFVYAAPSPTDTLISGYWPHRLLEVVGEPVTQYPPDYVPTGCVEFGLAYPFSELHVTRELPASLALGPNGLEVDAFLRRVERQTQADLTAMWEARLPVITRNETLMSEAVFPVAQRHGLSIAVMAAGYTARNLTRRWITSAWFNPQLVAEWDVAGDCVFEVGAALVVKNLIPAEDFELLYAPWREVVADG